MNAEKSIFSISVDSPCRLGNAVSYNELREYPKTPNTNDWFQKPSPIFRRNTVGVLMNKRNESKVDSKNTKKSEFTHGAQNSDKTPLKFALVT